MPIQIPAWLYPFLVPAAVAVALAGMGTWAYADYRRRKALREIDAAFDSVAYDLLKNVLIPNGMGGQIHLPYLLLTQRGLLVVHVMEMPGVIFGGDQMLDWTVIGQRRRYTFGNPQHALYDRMAAVKLLAGDVPVEGRIVFTVRSTFPKGKPKYVLRLDDLTSQYPLVDRTRGSVTAAFGDVWRHIKKHSAPDPLSK